MTKTTKQFSVERLADLFEAAREMTTRLTGEQPGRSDFAVTAYIDGVRSALAHPEWANEFSRRLDAEGFPISLEEQSLPFTLEELREECGDGDY